MSLSLSVIVLAAGKGKRMKSNLPKVLHRLCGREILSYVIDVGKSLNPAKLIVVTSKDKRMLKFLSKQGFIGYQAIKLSSYQETKKQYVIQEVPLGTGDAVKIAEKGLSDFNGDVLILAGDVPLLKKETLVHLVRTHKQKKAALTLLTSIVPEPRLYGRIIRKGDRVVRIVEDSDASEEEKLIEEINTGIYVFKKDVLFSALKKIKPDNVQKEYYLTDTIEIICRNGLRVISCQSSDYRETLGINDRKALSEVRNIVDIISMQN